MSATDAATVAAVVEDLLVEQMVFEYGEDDTTWREMRSAKRIADALLAAAPIAQALAAAEAVARVERRLAAGDGIDGIRAALRPTDPSA